MNISKTRLQWVTKNEGCLAAAPSFFILFTICAAVFLSSFTGGYIAVLGACLCTAALILLMTRSIVPNYFKIFAVVITAGAILSAAALAVMNKESAATGEISGSCKVVFSRKLGSQYAVILKSNYGKLAAYVRDLLPVGSRVKYSGVITDFTPSSQNKFNEMRYFRARGAVKKIALYYIEETSPPKGIDLWRVKLENMIEERLQPRSAAYMAAFTTGRRDEDETNLHKLAGTSHLLAVSGLHISLIAALLYVLCPLNGVSAVTVPALLWCYLLFAGLPVGGVRAVIMLTVLFLSSAFGRRSYGLNAVSVAAIIMLMINPWNAYDLGWQLSVLCACFIASSTWLNACAAVVVPVALWFVTLPLCAGAFGAVPMAGLVLNIFAVPLFAFICPAVILLSLPPLCALPGAAFCAGLSEFMLTCFDSFLQAGVSLIPETIGGSALFAANAVSLFVFSVCMYCRTGVARALFISALMLTLYSFCNGC